MTPLKCAVLAVAMCLLATGAHAQAVSPTLATQPPPAIAAPPPPPPPAPTLTAPSPSRTRYTPPEDVTGAGEPEQSAGDAYTPPEDIDAQDPAKLKTPGYSPPED